MHIYAIFDYKPTPSDNRGLEYIGRIYLEDHMDCVSLFRIEQIESCDIHPFEDTRLYSSQLSKLLRIFSQMPISDASSRIKEVLEQVKLANAGIMSFAD